MLTNEEKQAWKAWLKDQGLRNKDIALFFGISEDTWKNSTARGRTIRGILALVNHIAHSKSRSFTYGNLGELPTHTVDECGNRGPENLKP